MEPEKLKKVIEAAIFAADAPLSVDKIRALFLESGEPEASLVRELLQQLSEDYQDRGIELAQVASGWRFQVRSDCARVVSRLWEEKPQKYSRAFLETLALIAYRQPVTRGEIEAVRGVAVSSNIMRSMQEREWVRVVGHRDVPGRPSLYATTRQFLDDFGLKSLDQLPPLAELKDLNQLADKLELFEGAPPAEGDPQLTDDAAGAEGKEPLNPENPEGTADTQNADTAAVSEQSSEQTIDQSDASAEPAETDQPDSWIGPVADQGGMDIDLPEIPSESDIELKAVPPEQQTEVEDASSEGSPLFEQNAEPEQEQALDIAEDRSQLSELLQQADQPFIEAEPEIISASEHSVENTESDEAAAEVSVAQNEAESTDFESSAAEIDDFLNPAEQGGEINHDHGHAKATFEPDSLALPEQNGQDASFESDLPDSTHSELLDTADQPDQQPEVNAAADTESESINQHASADEAPGMQEDV